MSGLQGQMSLQKPINELERKLDDNDQDIRQQELIDLLKGLDEVTRSRDASSSSASHRPVSIGYTDDVTESRLVVAVLKRLNDEIAEVKNKAVACLAAMSRKSRPQHLKTIVDTLMSAVSSTDDEKRDIGCMALKAVGLEMPTDSSPILIESMSTKILSVLTGKTPPDPQHASELLQILTDIFLRFPHVISTRGSLQNKLLESLIDILSVGRPAVRKRAIPAVSALISTNSELFDTTLKSRLVEGLSQGGDASRTWINLLASLARGPSVQKIGEFLVESKAVDLVLGEAGDLEDVEAVEGALVALEVLVLRCPSEITPHIPAITQKGLELVKYDPNYVDMEGDDEEDVEMDGEDDEDDDFDDGYSDDDDVSWKIRRSAAKLLAALIRTRNELAIDFYRNALPVLINRFSEREESVRLEVLAAVESLLKQTATARAADLASAGRNKRKRNTDMDEESSDDESPMHYLQISLPQLVRAILKQLSAKSVPTRQQCFVLLEQIVEALGGGLDSESDAICTASISALRSIDSATTSSLAMAALSFLADFFRHHSPRVYGSHLAQLVPAIVRCMKDKLQRISFEAFAAASALAQAARPNGASSPLPSSFAQPIQKLFTATTSVLGDTSVDGDVRERALESLGSLLVHEGDTLSASYAEYLPLITARLANENTAATAVLVIGRIAEAQTCKGPEMDNWLLEILPSIVIALRRNRRPGGKNAEFTSLSHILLRVGSNLSPEKADLIIHELQPLLDSAPALQIIAIVLSHQPAARPAVEKDVLPAAIKMAKSASSVNLPHVDALTAFFAAYVDGDVDCATRLVPTLVDALSKAATLPDATSGGTAPYTTTARCVGAIVQHSRRNSAGILATFEKTIKSSKSTEAATYLALFCIGEIGRITDLSINAGLFERVLSFFNNESEEVRSAAAFAAGNLAVGSPKVFLPAVVKHITSADDEASRLLLLHALKEVILHSSSAQLELIADSLWTPLFGEESNARAKNGSKGPDENDLGDDGIRNVKAACIGKLTTLAPAKFLPQLQSLLKSTPQNRAIVAAAVRYTFIDTSSSYDELIAPIIVDFLSLMEDKNLIVRRLSLASLNAAIQHKPHLVVDRLAALQPLLYKETIIKPELQREVQMGPWKVIEDDGLENRKTAYETMYTLLGTCFSKVDLPEFTDRVMAALRDVNEIKVLALMLLLRLGQLSPSSVIPRLDDATEPLRVIMKDVEVKDDTVKQDLERKEEMQRNALRTAVPLYKMSTSQQAPVFHTFMSALLNDQWKDFRDYQG
ncbi:armadillo-type protein [Naematelia encephala]|uniref:Armadillo-type protein n=1 Tax=Naematelia encephala TaxID=71784 RepID=A0A1Y2AJZ6_9TREE|nr:armadillo-type protein [Naematelia encephala]